MISWHKAGQKVVLIKRPIPWIGAEGVSCEWKALPEEGVVYTVCKVELNQWGVCLHLLGFEHWLNGIRASHFRPVYPSAIDALRKLEAPVDVREDA